MKNIMYNLKTIQNIPDIKDAITKNNVIVQITGSYFRHSYDGFLSETGTYTDSLRTFLDRELSFIQKDYRIIGITIYINGLAYPILLSDNEPFSFLADDYCLTLGEVQKRIKSRFD